MLPATIAFQGLKPIGGRYPQIVQCGCGVQITQFAPRHLDQISGEAFTRFIVEDCFGQTVGLRGLRITVTVLHRNPSVGINVPAMLGADAEAMFMLGELV
jgi:hypothetical protein